MANADRKSCVHAPDRRGTGMVFPTLLLGLGLVLGGASGGWANQDPPGCSGTGVTLELRAFDAGGLEIPLDVAVKECQEISYQAKIAKPAGSTCAFEGGTITISTPDGVPHNATPVGGVPCLGGTIFPCIPGVNSIDSVAIDYVVDEADVSGGFILASVSYTAAFSHTGTPHTPGVPSAGTALPLTVELCPVDECNTGECTTDLITGAGVCIPEEPSTACEDTDNNPCTEAGCELESPEIGTCVQTHVLPDSKPCGDPNADECADPGCDGAGNCDPMHFPLPASVPCGDSDQNVCTEAGCDGLGSCDQRHVLPDSKPCPDDGTECAAPGCDGAGNCDQRHSPEPPSGPCGDTDQNDCTEAGCDGLGTCDQRHVLPDSKPCPDTENECVAAGCDGAGNCDQNHVLEQDSTPCTDTDGVECTTPGCNGLGECDQEHIPCPDNDHYKCYKTKQLGAKFAKRNVALEDQFETTVASVLTPRRFCNPVDKNGEGINDSTAHMMCYKITEPRFQRRDVVVENQFGVQTLTVLRPYDLCVPAEKDGVPSGLNMNHFKCYTVAEGSPKFSEQQVDLADQFETKATTVIRPRLLCNPVDKNGEGIVDANNHLTCYAIRDAAGQPRLQPQQVEVEDQFALQDLNTLTGDCRKLSYLCVPSTKRIASPSGAFLDATTGALD